MTLSVPFGREIRVDAVRKHIELVGNEGQQRRRWMLAGAQRATGKAQIAKHRPVAETVMIATAAADRGKISFGQRAVAHQLALLSRRLEQFRDLGFVQPLPSRHL